MGFDHLETILKGSYDELRGCEKISFPQNVLKAKGCLTAYFERQRKNPLPINVHSFQNCTLEKVSSNPALMTLGYCTLD